jgi:hypothetical protein
MYRIEVIGASAQNQTAAIAASVMAANCDLRVTNCDLSVTFTEYPNTVRGPKFQPNAEAHWPGAAASDVPVGTN